MSSTKISRLEAAHFEPREGPLDLLVRLLFSISSSFLISALLYFSIYSWLAAAT
jgi:hypothetical protein